MTADTARNANGKMLTTRIHFLTIRRVGAKDSGGCIAELQRNQATSHGLRLSGSRIQIGKVQINEITSIPSPRWAPNAITSQSLLISSVPRRLQSYSLLLLPRSSRNGIPPVGLMQAMPPFLLVCTTQPPQALPIGRPTPSRSSAKRACTAQLCERYKQTHPAAAFPSRRLLKHCHYQISLRHLPNYGIQT